MRIEMTERLKEELRVLAIRTRDRLHLTQREMAIRLVMSESSYSDIETGVSMCGTLTTVLLIAEQEDPDACLRHLRDMLSELYEQEMQPI